jgi:hypothetical protein
MGSTTGCGQGPSVINQSINDCDCATDVSFRVQARLGCPFGDVTAVNLCCSSQAEIGQMRRWNLR